MIIAVVVLAVVVVCQMVVVYDLTRKQGEASDARQRRMEAELLSVLGKTETVSIALSDERPKAQVRYMTEADEVESERVVA